MPADSDLIEMFESREEQAIAQTQTRYGGFCYSIAYRILGSPQDAEECVNDALLHLWNAIPPAKPKSFRAFLITMTRRLALDRKVHHQAAKRGGSETETSLDALPDVLPAADDNSALLPCAQTILSYYTATLADSSLKETGISVWVEEMYRKKGN